jgi:hypothetical protein
MLTVTASSVGQYSWYHRGPSPDASATSSMECDDAVDSTIGTPSSAAARATASSPSGCTIDITPMGASRSGAGIGVPSRVVDQSRPVVSRSIRGTIPYRSNAARLARIVAPPPAPPATYSKGPSSSTARAACSSRAGSVGHAGRSPESPAR